MEREATAVAMLPFRTESQMLRDDAKLRCLHKETLKRRKRFLAKEKQLQV